MVGATSLPKTPSPRLRRSIVTLSKIIDDHAAKYYTAEMPDLRMAADQMQMLADTLAPGHS